MIASEKNHTNIVKALLMPDIDIDIENNVRKKLDTKNCNIRQLL